MAKSNDKTHQKRIDKNCHIPDLVQAFTHQQTTTTHPQAPELRQHIHTAFIILFFQAQRCS